MRLVMLTTYGSFEKGKVYELGALISKFMVDRKLAQEVVQEVDFVPPNKSMKKEQIKKR